MPQEQSSSYFHFPEVRVVEASAGSGKTFALAKRYIHLLLDPALKPEEIPLKKILAITFTNKSALEMKERILSFLKRIAFDRLSQEEEEELFKSMGVPEGLARQKSFAIMDYMIRNYNYFRVQTIDSFINALLSGCAFRINLSANFKIKRNEEEYLNRSLDRLIDLAQKDKKVLKAFEDFLNQYIFLEHRRGWFPKKDMLELIGSLFKVANSAGLPFIKSAGGSADLIKKRKEVLKFLRRLKEVLPEKTDGKFVNSLETFLAHHSAGFSVDDLSSYFNREEFPMRKGEDIPERVEKLWSQIRQELAQLCEGEASAIFNCYIDVFARVVDELEVLTRKDDILFLSQLNEKARQLFDRENLTVEELYYRLASRFRHYLFDEFQDTSLLQWKNLFLMVEEALSTGGSLFYVGDKKQAIYAFRGGEVRLFDEIKEGFQPFNVTTEVLRKNWRSHKEIVEFNNEIFSARNLRRFILEQEQSEDKGSGNPIALRKEDIEDILKTFGDARQIPRSEKIHGYVKVDCLKAKTIDELQPLARKKLLQLIHGLRARFTLGDIAILSRHNAEVELITSWLMEEGILVESERTSNIKENFLVKEMISLLKFLDSPVDNLSFASFILGDIFAAAAGIKVEDLRHFVFEFHQAAQEQQSLYLYKIFREAYPKIWDQFFDEFFRTAGLFPLYELVVSLMSRFDCLNRFPDFQGFLMRFLELIQEKEEDAADIASFLEYFERADTEELFVNIAQDSAVKVLTIHKSKGLEFPVVIIPFLGMEVQVGAGGKRGEKSFVVEAHPDHLSLVYFKKRYPRFSPALAEKYRREYKKAFLSELNNIYVALTRACNELYVFIPQKSGGSFNPVNFLIKEESLERGTRVNSPAVMARLKDVTLKLSATRYRDWIDLLREEFSADGELTHRQDILKGKILHFILSFVGNLDREDKGTQLESAFAALPWAFPYCKDLKDFKIYNGIIQKVLSRKALKAFFYIPEGVVYREKELVDSKGETKRLDRLIVKEKEVWVIDYKIKRLSPFLRQSEEESYEGQVRGYMKLVRNLYPKLEVKGFLIYLEELESEEVAAE